MANLKRNAVELVKDVKAGELVTEVYLTPLFLSIDKLYEAMDVSEKVDGEDSKMTEKERLRLMMEFTVGLYENQFTLKDLEKGLHAPDAIDILRNQIMFAANGVQSDESKKLMAKKR